MGAIGAAILAHEEMEIMHYNKKSIVSSFMGWDIADTNYQTKSFLCDGCDNICEIVEIQKEGTTIGRWGGRCSKWDLTSDKTT
jgi:hypothetical protein